MSILPTLASGQAQTGMIPGHAATLCMVSIQMESGVKHRPTVTPNGHTERDNPLRALAGGRYCEQATSRMPQRTGLPKKPMPQGKLGDMLTWARDIGG
jgi:hypothetical protein